MPCSRESGSLTSHFLFLDCCPVVGKSWMFAQNCGEEDISSEEVYTRWLKRLRISQKACEVECTKEQRSKYLGPSEVGNCTLGAYIRLMAHITRFLQDPRARTLARPLPRMEVAACLASSACWRFCNEYPTASPTFHQIQHSRDLYLIPRYRHSTPHCKMLHSTATNLIRISSSIIPW